MADEGDGDEPMSALDEQLLADLRIAQTVRGERVPALVTAAARAAFTWRTVDDELARLGYDSNLDTPALAGVRGDGPRLLTFEAPGLAIDVELSESTTGRTLLGQASGPVAQLQLQRPDGSGDLVLDVDPAGGFRAEGLDPGVVRLRCLLGPSDEGLRIVSTEWVAI